MMVTPLSRKLAHHFPHVAAQFDVDAGGRLVEEQDFRLMRQRLGDQHAPLHAAGQRADVLILLVPQREVAQHPFDMGRDSRVLPNRPRENTTVSHTVSNMLTASSCGTRPIFLRARAIIRRRCRWPSTRTSPDVGAHEAADDADQRGLAGAVRPEQRENLAATDGEIDALQRGKAVVIGLGQLFDRQHIVQARSSLFPGAPFWHESGDAPIAAKQGRVCLAEFVLRPARALASMKER